jgi:methylated-DNA-protein-cysteine methyltransferase related protein
LEGFFNAVYDIVEKIPRGKVTTYGQIAAIIGTHNNARVVGWAMRAAPEERKLPCHRVVNKTGVLSPSYVFGDAAFQRAMLEAEGVTFKEDGRINIKKHLWDGK